MPNGDAAEADSYVRRDPLLIDHLACFARVRGGDQRCRERIGVVVVDTVGLFGSRHAWHPKDGVWTLTKRGLSSYSKKTQTDSTWTPIHSWSSSAPGRWWIKCPHCRHTRCVDLRELGVPASA